MLLNVVLTPLTWSPSLTIIDRHSSHLEITLCSISCLVVITQERVKNDRLLFFLFHSSKILDNSGCYLIWPCWSSKIFSCLSSLWFAKSYNSCSKLSVCLNFDLVSGVKGVLGYFPTLPSTVKKRKALFLFIFFIKAIKLYKKCALWGFFQYFGWYLRLCCKLLRGKKRVSFFCCFFCQQLVLHNFYVSAKMAYP